MKIVSGFSSIESSNFKIALGFSMGLHLLMVSLIPSMTIKESPPLKEMQHNKVRLTFTKKPKPQSRPSTAEKRSHPVVEHPVMKMPPVSAVQPRESPSQFQPKMNPVKAISMSIPKVEAVSRVSPVTPNTLAPVNLHQAKALNRKTSAITKVDIQGAAPRKVAMNEMNGPARSATSLRQRTSVPASWKSAAVSRNLPSIGSVPVTKVRRSRISGGKQVTARVVPVQPRIQMATKNDRENASVDSRGRATLETTRPGALPVNPAIVLRAPTLNRVTEAGGSAKSSRRVSHSGGFGRIAGIAPRKITPVPLNDDHDSKISEKDLKRMLGRFFQSVGKQIARAKVYPDFARRMGYQGKILVAFEIGRDGRLLSLSVNQSSGIEILDEAALEAVKEAGPYPPIPEKIQQESIKMKLPISYFLR